MVVTYRRQPWLLLWYSTGRVSLKSFRLDFEMKIISIIHYFNININRLLI